LKAGKAYLSSLGTTGLLVASSLILLVVVGALIAFDAWPDGAAAGKPEDVALGTTKVASDVKAAHAHSSPSTAPRATLSRGARVTGRASARTTRSRSGKAVARDEGRPISGSGDVVSSLPHPTTDSNGGSGGHPLPPATTPSAPGPPPVSLPTSTASSAGSTGPETTDHVAAVVSGISPQAGALVEGVGDTVDGFVGAILPADQSR
jgi:hypothetical protein